MAATPDGMGELPAQTEALSRLSAFTSEHGDIMTLEEVMFTTHLDIDGNSQLAGTGFDKTQELALEIEGLDLPLSELVGKIGVRSLLVNPEVTQYFPSPFKLEANQTDVMLLRGAVEYVSGKEMVGRRQVVYCFKPGVAQLLDIHFMQGETIEPENLFKAGGSILSPLGSRQFLSQPRNPSTPPIDVENAILHRMIDKQPHLSFLGPELGLSRETLPQLVRWMTTKD